MVSMSMSISIYRTIRRWGARLGIGGCINPAFNRIPRIPSYGTSLGKSELEQLSVKYSGKIMKCIPRHMFDI
jgi:hypothetical protein